MKWTKVSRAYLDSYIEFCDIFLLDPYATFILCEIKKNQDWHNLAHSEDSRLFQTYFHFLELAMWAGARYRIFLDDSSFRKYRWQSLRYVLSLPHLRGGMPKKIVSLVAQASDEQDVLQLVDVLLGALTSQASASPKAILAAHVRSAMNSLTQTKNPKLREIVWAAPKKRWFVPTI